MKTKEVSLSETGLFQILQTIGRMDLPLLEGRPGGAREYLAACREWEALGWGAPDFDGGFLPSRLFARLVYTLKETQCALRYDEENGHVHLFLRGRIDLLSLRKVEAQQWRISFQPFGKTRKALCARLLSAQGGTFSVQTAGQEVTTSDLADTLPDSEARLRAVNEQLVRFYPKFAAEGVRDR